MWEGIFIMPHYTNEDLADDSTKDLARIYERSKSIEETLVEYVEDELLNPTKPDLNNFEIAVEALKKFALGSFDNNPKCKRSSNDIEMAIILWIADEKQNKIKRSDLVKRLNILGDFIIEEAKMRLRQ